MRQIVRPLSTDQVPEPGGQASRFDSSWPRTVRDLETEIAHLIVGEPEYVIQIDVQESDLKLDGGLRANARPGSSAVIVSFETKHGPLQYPCNTYSVSSWGRGRSKVEAWHDNVRAVAKTLEALRAVDRYGAAPRGQQYTGFRSLGPGAIPLTEVVGRELALRLFRETGVKLQVDFSTDDLRSAWRTVAKAHHPDNGGDPDTFSQLEEAHRVLGC